MRHTWLPLLALTIACAPADDKNVDDTDTDVITETDDTDAVDDTDVATAPLADHIAFDLQLDGTTVACDTDLVGLGSASTTVQLLDARLFVFDLELSGPTSGTLSLSPADDGAWQAAGVTLLDFEDATGLCAATGSAATNDRVMVEVPDGDWDTLTFSIGVPFAENHKDPVTQPVPLSLSSMYWSWQGGHKFARIDVRASGAETGSWNFHLGSTGCSSSSSLSAPELPCDKPNIPRIAVDFDPRQDVVVFDLAALFSGADLTANTEATPPGCMSNPADSAECTPLFTNLGMDFTTGGCTSDCDGQTVITTP